MRIVTYKRMSGKGTITQRSYFVPDDGYIFRKGEEEKSAISVDEIEGWEETVLPVQDPAEQEISAEEAMSIITGGAENEA